MLYTIPVGTLQSMAKFLQDESKHAVESDGLILSYSYNS